MRQIISNLSNHPFVPRHPIARQFIKFAMVGVVNTMTSFSIYFVGTRLLQMPPLLANAIAFVVAVTVSYALNKRWTFRDTRRVSASQYSRFVMINIVGLALSEIIIAALHHGLGWNDIVAFFGAVLIVMFWNFGANRLWTFSARPVLPDQPLP
jgi:putative flippase GtrA